MTKVVNDPRKPYSYTVLEYAALWLNDKHHSRPDSTGQEMHHCSNLTEYRVKNCLRIDISLQMFARKNEGKLSFLVQLGNFKL